MSEPESSEPLTAEKAESLSRASLDRARELAAEAARLRAVAPQRRGPHVRKRSLAIDFDGVIHAYRKGWHDGTLYDGPNDGAVWGLKTLMELHPVFIFSTRKPEDIAAWMHEHAGGIQVAVIPEEMPAWETMGVLGITNRKLPAAVIVDDRAVRFTNWRDVVNLLG